MVSNRIKVGIVGLGRWAKVLTRAARIRRDRDRLSLQPFGGEAERDSRRNSASKGPDLATCWPMPEIKGVILTVPNEQHLPLAREVAKAGKHVYTEKPIASTLEEGLAIEALEKTYGVTVTVGHSARLMAGIRAMGKAIEAGELGRVGFMEANFSNERALELTPKAWRWYKDRAPGGPLSQLAIHQFDVLHYLGGEILEANSIASKLSPVGAEVDDQSMTVLRFADGKIGYVGSSWTSPGVFCVRVFGSKGLMHYEIDFGPGIRPTSCIRPRRSTFSAAKTATASAKSCPCRKATCFAPSSRCSLKVVGTGRPNELNARNGNVALAVVYAGPSVDRAGWDKL